MSGYRIEGAGQLSGARKIAFYFEGKLLYGKEGETVASALIANGVDIVARSFKYHRPRGIFSSGLDEPNAVFDVGSDSEGLYTPNQKATSIYLQEGMILRSVNNWPSLKFDLLSLFGMISRFIPAGFYYKTFKWPNWWTFEHVIRRAAGLGRAPRAVDVSLYDARIESCDVLVVGGGLCGLEVAANIAQNGAKVILAEQENDWGGQLLSSPCSIEGCDSSTWIANQITKLTAARNVKLFLNTMAFGYYDHNLVGLVEGHNQIVPSRQTGRVRQRLLKVRAKFVVLATGAFERPLVFSNNDRPGVMLAGAAATYASRFGVAVGRDIIIATNNSSSYEIASILQEAGLNIKTIVDARVSVPEYDKALAKKCDFNIIAGSAVTNVLGKNRVKCAVVANLAIDGKPLIETKKFIKCDTILTSAGWSPAVHLFSQSGGKLFFENDLLAFCPGVSPQNVICVGASSGASNLDSAMRDASIKSRNVLAELNILPKIGESESDSADHGDIVSTIRPLWQIELSKTKFQIQKAWLDLQNDVTVADVKLAMQENYQSVEHVKRYTTLGMGTDQGKSSNVNAIGVMQQVSGKSMAKVGTTTFRPPFDPISVGVMAGQRIGANFRHQRRLVAHGVHEHIGAVFEEYGGWLRPAYYRQGKESEPQSVANELECLRTNGCLFDSSPLGKIEIVGPDAAEFLNRIYVNNVTSLRIGDCRYGLILKENGVIFDDGIVARLAPDHFLVGTTSGNSAKIYHWLEEWHQCEWPELAVVIEDVTTAWAVVTVAGPNARALLSTIDLGVDVSRYAFAHLQMRQGLFSGAQARIQRVSFTGELSFEVSVPWALGTALWDSLSGNGAAFGFKPMGVESLMAARIEKGFFHLGTDTDGTTMPQDVGFGAIVSKKKNDFVGRRSLFTQDGKRDDRHQLVGLEVIDGGPNLAVGAHVLLSGLRAPCVSSGWVTSSIESPTLKRPIALALIRNGRQRLSEVVNVFDRGLYRKAKISASCFFDPKGLRMND